MSTDNKISTLVSDQLPDFVREEGPKLEAFIKGYYEWMEQQNNVLHESNSLLTYHDVDTTVDKYLEFLQREIFSTLPDDIRADKKLVAKVIRDMYRMKGTKRSYQFLFRVLYDEDIDIYFPGDYILKTSDGRWIKPTILRVTGISDSFTHFYGKIITGQQSGAKARVQRIEQKTEFGILITELQLSSLVGNYIDGETVITEDSAITGIVFNDIGELRNVIVQSKGLGHRIGDTVNLLASQGTGANGNVSQVDDTSAIEFTITEGGQGYRANSAITISGIGTGATFEITSLSNTEVISYNTDVILPMANVVLGTGPTFVSLGANTSGVSANLASANISSTIIDSLAFSNLTVGTINSITTTAFGSGYSILPEVTVIDQEVVNLQLDSDITVGGIKGENAVITPTHIPGALEGVVVNTNGSSYNKFETITIVNQTAANTTNATGAPIISGQVNTIGKYIDTKGWLSWDNRLQDGFFYQEFSYVIRSENFVDTYRQAVNDVLHPAGTKMFGDVVVTAAIDGSPSIERDIVISRHIGAVANVSSLSGESDVQTSSIAILPDVEDELTAEMFFGFESYSYKWTLGAGTVSIGANSHAVTGNNTVFDNTIGDCGVIWITATDGATPNGAYNAAASTNTALALTNSYESADGSLSHGTYWVANLVSYASDWGLITLAANNFSDSGSITLTANTFLDYGLGTSCSL